MSGQGTLLGVWGGGYLCGGDDWDPSYDLRLVRHLLHGTQQVLGGFSVALDLGLGGVALA